MFKRKGCAVVLDGNVGYDIIGGKLCFRLSLLDEININL